MTIKNNTSQFPSDEAVLAKLNSNPKTISATLAPRGGTHKKEIENGVVVDNYYRGFTIKMITDDEGVYYIQDGEYKYQNVGGNYVFKRSYVVQGQYEGIPFPEESEVVALVKTDLRMLLRTAFNRLVGEVETIEFADPPKWKWHKPSSVSLVLKLVYTENDRKLKKAIKVQQLYQVRLYREGFSGPFERFGGCKTVKGEEGRKILSE